MRSFQDESFEGVDPVSPSVAPAVQPSKHGGFGIGNRGLVRLTGRLMIPAVAPAMLFVIAWPYGVAFTTPYQLLAALSFFVLHPAPWSGNESRVSIGFQVISPWLAALLILGAISGLTGSFQHFDRNVLALWAVATPLAQICLLPCLPSFLAFLVRLRRDEHRVVIIGANAVGIAFARELQRRPVLHSRVLGFFDGRRSSRLGHLGGLGLLGGLDALSEFTRRERVDQIYVALPVSAQPRVVAMLEALRDCTASVYFLPNLPPVDLIQPRIDIHASFPVVSVCESPFHGIDEFIKRGSDLVLSTIALVLTGPLMLLIAAAIKLTSSGPVIFKQKRYGLDGSEITVWKFRSMTVTEDGAQDYTQVTRGDGRVTAVGKILRATSMDELPQFFNVLQGKMSIVGPRPHALKVNEQYRSLIPGYMIRHKVRPGITGWAQIHGYRGGDDLESMTKRVEYDLIYLRDWSVWMDLRIILRTVLLVVRDQKAY
ncbi:MAG: undecaprenyl-phosphate glucose phosphotransferase [Lautropia sp.]